MPERILPYVDRSTWIYRAGFRNNYGAVGRTLSKILVMEFMIVKISWYWNSKQKVSTQWNKQLSRNVFFKVIECLEKSNPRMNTKHSNTKIKNKWIEYKIFELNYGNTKVSNVWKYKIIRFVFAIFASTCLY